MNPEYVSFSLHDWQLAQFLRKEQYTYIFSRLEGRLIDDLASRNIALLGLVRECSLNDNTISEDLSVVERHFINELA